MDLDGAIKSHGEWKIKLRKAIAAHEHLDATHIAKDDSCELGRWLHGEAKRKYAHLKSYQRAVDDHARFHREVSRVASEINAERYSHAEAMIGAGTPYSAASTGVGVAVIGLRKETGL